MTNKSSSDRSFGLVFSIFFCIVGLWPLRYDHSPNLWFLLTALSFFAIAVVKPTLLHLLNQIWTQFGLLLHHIISPLVMGILFFITITPIGWYLRLVGQRPLQLKLDSQIDSYWMDKINSDPDSMKRQF
ncbi:MAG: SxtJ family membrane protein [Magnetococcus sp. DMHC-6]